MRPQNHGSSLKQIANRNRKVPSPNPEKPCNLKPAQNRKIDSRSAAYAFFTGDYVKGRKRAVVALVERGGKVRSFSVPSAHADAVVGIVRENIDRETQLHTDESRLYTKVGREFAAHETVNHAKKEYARDNVTTNTIEGYFSIFKRGMRGVYQHCDEKHLHRYLAEFDFRYNNRVKLGVNDGERAALAVKSAAGKRLTYRQSH